MSRKGQTVLEYAVVIICAVGALIAMREYMTRSIQGRMRASADEIGQQYDAEATTGDVTMTYRQDSDTTVRTTTTTGPASALVTRTDTTFNERTTTNGSETIGP